MLVVGGVQWLVSGAIPSQATQAKERITSAILGLGLVLISFILVQTLNPELTTIQEPLLGAGSEGGGGRAICAAGVFGARGSTCAKLPKKFLPFLFGTRDAKIKSANGANCALRKSSEWV